MVYRLSREKVKMMINVIGMGYIGLPTALILASAGNEVVGTDVKKDVIRSLDDGHITFQEDGLAELFTKACASGIRFSSAYQKYYRTFYFDCSTKA